MGHERQTHKVLRHPAVFLQEIIGLRSMAEDMDEEQAAVLAIRFFIRLEPARYFGEQHLVVLCARPEA